LVLKANKVFLHRFKGLAKKKKEEKNNVCMDTLFMVTWLFTVMESLNLSMVQWMTAVIVAQWAQSAMALFPHCGAMMSVALSALKCAQARNVCVLSFSLKVVLCHYLESTVFAYYSNEMISDSWVKQFPPTTPLTQPFPW